MLCFLLHILTTLCWRTVSGYIENEERYKEKIYLQVNGDKWMIYDYVCWDKKCLSRTETNAENIDKCKCYSHHSYKSTLFMRNKR